MKIIKTTLSFFPIFALSVLPAFTFAAGEGIGGLIDDIGGIVYLLLPISSALATVFFFWGMAKFILRAADETAREEGKEVMKWGIVALFVILSIWGILGFIGTEFDISSDTGILFRLR